MHVALLTFYPLDTRFAPGGIRMVSLNLVEALRCYDDLRLTVIHCHSDNTDERILTDGHLTIHYVAMPKHRIVPNLMTAVRRLVHEVQSCHPDLVHAHAAHLAYAGIRAGFPTIYTVHGVLPREQQIYSGSLYDRLRYGLLAYYERRALPRAQQLVAISAYVQEAYGRVTGRWARINNPVPATFFELPDRAEPGTILYAGSITEIKDLLTLLRAVERVREVHPQVSLRIAGRVTSPQYAERVQAFVRERGLDETVRFLGLVDRSGILEEYARCAVVALASVQENAPMTLVEGMAAGKPVVATRVGGIPDMVSEGETGFLASPGDDRAMAEHLVRLLADDGLRRRMGTQARAEMRAQFSSEAVAKAYHDLYQRVWRATRH